VTHATRVDSDEYFLERRCGDGSVFDLKDFLFFLVESPFASLNRPPNRTGESIVDVSEIAEGPWLIRLRQFPRKSGPARLSYSLISEKITPPGRKPRRDPVETSRCSDRRQRQKVYRWRLGLSPIA